MADTHRFILYIQYHRKNCIQTNLHCVTKIQYFKLFKIRYLCRVARILSNKNTWWCRRKRNIQGLICGFPYNILYYVITPYMLGEGIQKFIPRPKVGVRSPFPSFVVRGSGRSPCYVGMHAEYEIFLRSQCVFRGTRPDGIML